MKSETRVCQNCHQNFLIELEDFNFYEKIKVPPPTFCPPCRTIRRLCWRNEMSLYRRTDDAPNGKGVVISMYHPEEKLIVYDNKYWWGDAWDPTAYGFEYDFTKSFFEQWKVLRDSIPAQALSNANAVNSEYCNVALDSKDSYLCSASWEIERTFYSNRISKIKDSSDLYFMHRSELCYDDVICADSYRLFYSLNCKSCVDSYFLYDCVGCTDCFGCSNLRNKSYCMWNEQLSKEEYSQRLSSMDLTDYKVVEENKIKFKELCLSALHKFSNQIKAIGSTGDNLEGIKNCKYIFDATGNVEDSKYVHWVAKMLKDGYDSGPGVGEAELVYEIFDTGVGNYRNLFTSVVYGSNDIEYSFNCYGCSHLFGCIGLRNKKHCILNKQYSPEEYEILVAKIKKQMIEVPYVDKRGLVYKYGEFFPVEMSTFCYNETQAQDYFPLTKDEALAKGYRWRERKVNDYEVTFRAEDLPGSINDIDDSILDAVISCLHDGKCTDRCTGAFRVTRDELSLYRKLGVPLPWLCFGCRHDARLRMRNPMKLWRGTCMCRKDHAHHEGKCGAEFDTPYAPDRPEIIYCEKCYQAEVY